MSTVKPAGQGFFDRIPTTDGPNSASACEVLYNEWAATYDQDLTDPSQGYVGPVNAAKEISSNIDAATREQAIVLDAGCGTGLSGIAVRDALGPSATIDGIDISTAMLQIATKTNIYRSLDTANLSQGLSISDRTYDAVVCVGTLTGGHVGPVPALREFVRVCKQGGLVVATIKESVWASGGYEAEVKHLVDSGIADLRSAESVPYREGQGVNAVMLVLVRL